MADKNKTEEDKEPVARKARKVKLFKSDVPEAQYIEILKFLNTAMDKTSIEKDIATSVKKNCDTQLTGTWHCVVGRNFGCSITHDTKYVLFLQLDQANVLLFKSFE
jgi:dynein light chain LC8-type